MSIFRPTHTIPTSRHSLVYLYRPIAHLLWLEVRRTQLLCLGAGLLALIGVLGYLVQKISLGDAGQAPLLLCAGLYRLTCSLLVGIFVVSSVQRRMQEQQIAQQLTLPIARAHWLLLQFLGYGGLALGFAAFYALPILLWQRNSPSLAWAFTLMLEALLVSGLALTLALSAHSQTSALSFLLLTYLLARLLGSALLLVTHPLLASVQTAYWAGLLAAVGWLVPRLDWFARSAWLTGEAFEYSPALLQTLLYWPLLYAVAAHDLRQQEW